MLKVHLKVKLVSKNEGVISIKSDKNLLKYLKNDVINGQSIKNYRKKQNH